MRYLHVGDNPEIEIFSCSKCGKELDEIIVYDMSYLCCKDCKWKCMHESSGDTRRIFMYDMSEEERQKNVEFYELFIDEDNITSRREKIDIDHSKNNGKDI